MDKNKKLISKLKLESKANSKILSEIGMPWVIKKSGESTAILAIYNEPVENQVSVNVKIITNVRLDTEAKRLLEVNDNEKVVILHDDTQITCREPTIVNFENGSILTKKHLIYIDQQVEKDFIKIFIKGQTAYIPKGTKIEILNASNVAFEIQTRVERREVVTWRKGMPVPLIVGIDMIFRQPVMVKTEVTYALKDKDTMKIMASNKLIF